MPCTWFLNGVPIQTGPMQYRTVVMCANEKDRRDCCAKFGEESQSRHIVVKTDVARSEVTLQIPTLDYAESKIVFLDITAYARHVGLNRRITVFVSKKAIDLVHEHEQIREFLKKFNRWYNWHN